MSVLNAVALTVLGFLLLRKLVLMDRFFVVRAVLITAFLCGVLLLLFSLVLSGTQIHCSNSYAPDDFFCPRF